MSSEPEHVGPGTSVRGGALNKNYKHAWANNMAQRAAALPHAAAAVA